MDLVVLDDIPFEVNIKQLYTKLHTHPNSDYSQRLEDLAEEAQQIAKPRALYKLGYIEEKGEDYIIVDNVKFSSKILRVNVEEVNRVFPFVVTCGIEIEEWAGTINDMMDSYIADVIQEMACKSALNALISHIDEHYNLEEAAQMNPGSLADWPIREQKKLMDVLENKNNLIGVKLKDSFLMTPIKTVSGIRFASNIKYENCQLCPRLECPNRKAPYDKYLYERRYAGK